MIDIKVNINNVEEYNYLYDQVGWGRYNYEISKKALDNTLYSVSVYDDENIIGYGRIIGDGICFLYIHDVMVLPAYQGKKIGTKIMNELLKYIKSIKLSNPNARIYLGASKGKEDFYRKFGFITRSEADLGSGMIYSIKKITTYSVVIFCVIILIYKYKAFFGMFSQLKNNILGLAISFSIIIFSLFGVQFVQAAANNDHLINFNNNQTNGQASSDAIAIRVFNNDLNFSAREWYDNNVSTKRSLQSLVVDGYSAVRDSRTVYVAASNVARCNTVGLNDGGSSFCLTPIIAVISFNQNISTETVDIFGQILNNWKFNKNLISLPSTCSNNNATVCSSDSDCHDNGFCSSQKSKVIRDTQRLIDIASIKYKLDNYRQRYQHYPNLEAGSYLPNKTLSVWPSWQKTLATKLGSALPVDPINKLGPCSDGGFNSTTCWNDVSKRFYSAINNLNGSNSMTLPAGSLAIRYEFINNTEYNLCTKFETNYYNISQNENNCTDGFNNGGPIINCRNILGLPNRPFTGFVEVSDNEGDQIASISISPTSLAGWAAISAQLTPDRHYIKITSNQAGPNNRYTLNVTATDSLGASSSASCSILIGGSRYTLTYTPGTGGSISGSRNQIVDQGSSGTPVVANPQAGKHFVKWSDNNDTNSQRTDINVSGNITATAIFENNPSYTLSFDVNGGRPLSSDSKSVTQGLPVGELPTPTRDGHAFEGWNTQQNGSGVTYTATTPYNNSGDLILYAQWSRNSFNLTYNHGAGGMIQGTSQQTVSLHGDGSQVIAYPNTNYGFLGWSDGQTGATRTDTNIIQDLTVDALFSQNSWQCGTSFIDDRDNHTYDTIAINGQCWMKKNLRWLPTSGVNAINNVSSTAPRYYVYNINVATSNTAYILQYFNYNKYGVLYNWPAAQSACPTGWTLPTNDEFNTLANALGGINSAGPKMKTPTEWGSSNGISCGGNNSSGFTAYPSGYKDISGFMGFSASVKYWTNTNYNTSDARHRTLSGCSSDGNSLYQSHSPKYFANYVRCFKPIIYVIKYVAVANGSITGSTTQTVNYSSSTSPVRAIPASGYKFKNWSDNYTVSASRTDVNVTSNKTVTANFELDTPPIVDR
ncbi:MAG TPA: GNAT family N-acetyltransferase [bacterium]|nr:GNAT family N-acetyltransferase [bacterium]